MRSLTEEVKSLEVEKSALSAENDAFSNERDEFSKRESLLTEGENALAKAKETFGSEKRMFLINTIASCGTALAGFFLILIKFIRLRGELRLTRAQANSLNSAKKDKKSS